MSASHCLWTVVAIKTREHNIDTSSSEYETRLSMEKGVLSAIGKEEEFSHVKVHGKNQDLLAECWRKTKAQ